MEVNKQLHFIYQSLICLIGLYLFFLYLFYRLYKEAAIDAERCIALAPKFPKGYLHLARCQLQTQRYSEAESTLDTAVVMLGGGGKKNKKNKDKEDEDDAAAVPEFETAILPQLNEIRKAVLNAAAAAGRSSSSSSSSGKSNTPSSRNIELSPQQKAEQFKDRGNACYKEGN